MYKIIKSERITTGDRIGKLLKEKGMSQKQLAQEIGISEPTLSKWRNNASGKHNSNLQILADYFDVDIEYLQCRQVEKRKTSFKEFNFDDNSFREYAKWRSFENWLINMGYCFKVNMKPTELESVLHEEIQDGILYTIQADTVSDAEVTYTLTTPDRKKKTVTLKDMEDLYNQIVSFTKFKCDEFLK